MTSGMLASMLDVPPSERIWSAVNKAIEGEDMGPTFATVIAGFTQLIIEATGLTEDQARAHLAAICLSPSGGDLGSLEPLLADEFERMRAGDGVVSGNGSVTSRVAPACHLTQKPPAT